MLLIDAVNIKKSFGAREILSFKELKIMTGDKIGIVGPNGAGKTTLMNILAGELLPDEGIVKSYTEVAYIRQFSDSTPSEAAHSMDLRRFKVSDKVECDMLSGGERTRLKIAQALSKNGVLLMADEPTANLDIHGIELLRQELIKAETVILISHDRDLLNRVCNKIIEVEAGKIQYFQGDFAFYKQQKQILINTAKFEYESYIDEKKRLEEEIVNRQAKAKSIRKAPSRMGNSEARLHIGSTSEKQKKLFDRVKGIQTRLDKLEVKSKPHELPVIKLDFSLTNPPENKYVISGQNFSFSYDKSKLFENANFKIVNGIKQAILGGNGTGKTTLLNEIYKKYFDGLAVDGKVSSNTSFAIRIVPKAKLGYFYQGFENLEKEKTVLENVMKDSVQNETTARTILARLLLAAESVYKRVEVLSGGEKIKVSFAKLFVSDANVLLLDEPTNYLDMASIQALQDILKDYEGTVLFVSHDKEFVEAVAQRLIVITDKKTVEFEGGLKAYEEHLVDRKQDVKKIDKMLLQLRMTEVISKLSKPKADKDTLEKEYQELLLQMRDL